MCSRKDWKSCWWFQRDLRCWYWCQSLKQVQNKQVSTEPNLNVNTSTLIRCSNYKLVWKQKKINTRKKPLPIEMETNSLLSQHRAAGAPNSPPWKDQNNQVHPAPASAEKRCGEREAVRFISQAGLRAAAAAPGTYNRV